MMNEHVVCEAVGLLPGAAGAVLLPEVEIEDGMVDALRSGRWDQLPDEWAFIGRLAAGEDAPQDEDDPIARYNAAVLRGDASGAMDASGRLGPSARALAIAAAYRLGGLDVMPEVPGDEVDPRVRAYVLATRAHAAAETGDAADGVTGLREASSLVAESDPATAARLLGESAAVAIRAGIADVVTLVDLEQATTLLEPLAFDDVRGELLMTRAELLMQMGADRPALLPQAVQCLQKATQALPRKREPIAYAICHLNIAVAYLSMPMSEHADRLRAAIAVQSLREAIEILDEAEQPDLWQSATINLANALQHLPSSHVAANLTEAVSLYEKVLPHREEPGVARARLLGNLGNALAHLGRLDEARPRLDEARGLFARLEDADAVAGIDGVLAEMDAIGERGAAS